MTAAKNLGFVIFGAAAIAACCITPAPAHADELPGVTAVWFAPGTDLWPADGQTLKATIPSDSLDLAFVQSTADVLGCGFTIQGDVYSDDATTAALIAAGKLYAPGTPAESWPGGQYLPEYSTVFYTGDCVTVPPVVPPVVDVPAAPVIPADVPVSPRVVAAVVQATTKTPELAATGVDMATPVGAGFLFIVGGIILGSVKHMKKRESK